MGEYDISSRPTGQGNSSVRVTVNGQGQNQNNPEDLDSLLTEGTQTIMSAGGGSRRSGGGGGVIVEPPQNTTQQNIPQENTTTNNTPTEETSLDTNNSTNSNQQTNGSSSRGLGFSSMEDLQRMLSERLRQMFGERASVRPGTQIPREIPTPENLFENLENHDYVVVQPGLLNQLIFHTKSDSLGSTERDNVTSDDLRKIATELLTRGSSLNKSNFWESHAAQDKRKRFAPDTFWPSRAVDDVAFAIKKIADEIDKGNKNVDHDGDGRFSQLNLLGLQFKKCFNTDGSNPYDGSSVNNINYITLDDFNYEPDMSLHSGSAEAQRLFSELLSFVDENSKLGLNEQNMAMIRGILSPEVPIDSVIKTFEFAMHPDHGGIAYADPKDYTQDLKKVYSMLYKFLKAYQPDREGIEEIRKHF